MRREKQNLHRGRNIWRDPSYPRCVSPPSTAISRPYSHHVRGVEDPTPVWSEKHFHGFLPAIQAEEQNGVEDVLACDDGGQMAMQATLDIPEPRNRRQAMESQD